MAEIINMPKLGFDMAEGVLVRWVKQVGEPVNKGDVLAEIETDKATVEVESAFSGVVLQLLVSEGDVIPVNDPIAVVGEEGEDVEDLTSKGEEKSSKVESQKSAEESETDKPEAPKSDESQSEISNQESKTLKASPLAKKVARDKGVDLGSVVGSGPGGRIVRRDIEKALTAGQKADTREVEKSSTRLASVEYSKLADESIQTTKLRQAIGRRLVESKTTIPHFYVTHEYKMEALMALRKQLNGYLPDGEKLSVNDFILKAVALSLREFPNLNATLKGDEIIRRGGVNVGVAVTVPGGLMTVVVKDTDQKPCASFRARSRRWRPAPVTARSSPKMWMARPFRLPIWACTMSKTSLPSSTRPKRPFWLSVRRAKCRLSRTARLCRAGA
jgi:pyruvate dehydrogenase E2 component (dihydrolipoamide acetyltransferase)